MRIGCIPPRAFPTAPTRFRLRTTSGWFLLAASNSARPSGTKQPSEVRPSPPCGARTVAGDRRRLRNLSVPTIRSSKTSGSTPAGQRRPAGPPRGNRDPRRRGATARHRVGRSWKHTRSSGHLGRAMVRVVLRMGDSGRRPGGQSKRRWGPVCAAAPPMGSMPHTRAASNAVAVAAPVRRAAPPAGPESLLNYPLMAAAPLGAMMAIDIAVSHRSVTSRCH
jgi:hypothetical protein